MKSWTLIWILVTILILTALLTPDAHSATLKPHWHKGVASSYGPSLYGNKTASGIILRRSTRGVAHKRLPLGTRLRVCHSRWRRYASGRVWRRKCVVVRVVDRGPYVRGRVLDLTAATTRDLCRCSSRVWGSRVVRWRRA